MTESIYERARISPLLRYYLRGVMDTLKESNCTLPMGNITFFDANDKFHKLVITNGDWMEVPR